MSVSLHSSLREEQENGVVLEDLLESMEADAFVALYSQVRTRRRGPGPFPSPSGCTFPRRRGGDGDTDLGESGAGLGKAPRTGPAREHVP